MTSPFESLCGPGKSLKAEPTDAAEFAGLKRSAHARLKDARNENLSLESRFDLAYNAAHALCLAALRSHGYRLVTDTSCFNCCRRRSVLGRMSGECFPNVTTSATWVSMRAT